MDSKPGLWIWDALTAWQSSSKVGFLRGVFEFTDCYGSSAGVDSIDAVAAVEAASTVREDEDARED